MFVQEVAWDVRRGNFEWDYIAEPTYRVLEKQLKKQRHWQQEQFYDDEYLECREDNPCWDRY